MSESEKGDHLFRKAPERRSGAGNYADLAGLARLEAFVGLEEGVAPDLAIRGERRSGDPVNLGRSQQNADHGTCSKVLTDVCQGAGQHVC